MKHGKCEACGKYGALQIHHKFSNSILNRKLYGKLINDERNFQYLDADCHLSKKTGIIIWSELQFTEAMGIEPRSKIGKEVWERMRGNNEITV